LETNWLTTRDDRRMEGMPWSPPFPITPWIMPVRNTAAIRTNIAAKKMRVGQSTCASISRRRGENTRTGIAPARAISGILGVGNCTGNKGTRRQRRKRVMTKEK